RLGGERARVRVQVCSQRRVGEGRQGAANANASLKTRALGKLRCAQAPAWSLGISPKGLGADQSVREGCGLGVTLFDCGPHLARARERTPPNGGFHRYRARATGAARGPNSLARSGVLPLNCRGGP